MPRAFIAVAATGVRVPDWSPPNPLAPPHFTLRFLGDVATEELEAVRGAMDRAGAATAPFSLELVGVGAFPSPGRPRVVWVGVGAGREDLVALADRLSRELSAAGWTPDPRPFAPHLTLLRVAHPRQMGAARRLLDLGPDVRCGDLRVEEFLLRESELTRPAAVHTTIGVSPLCAGPNPPSSRSAPRPSVSKDTG